MIVKLNREKRIIIPSCLTTIACTFVIFICICVISGLDFTILNLFLSQEPYIQPILNNNTNVDLENINNDKILEKIAEVKVSENITNVKDLENINNIKILEDIKTQEIYGKKFLTYLPHSGFSNQLISLKNAIILAYITNRTLIIPPIVYGEFLGFYYNLYEKLNRAVIIKKARLLCSINRTMFCKNKYREYDSVSMINWDNLFDFTFVREYVQVINRGFDFNLQTLKTLLNLTTTSSDENEDVYYLIEKDRYEFQYFDTDNSNIEIGHRYKKKYFISNLISRPETLIHLESAYGEERIVLEQTRNIDLYNGLLTNFKFGQPKLKECVRKIVEELGGRKSFIGVHIRTGDGSFRFTKKQVIDSVLTRLVDKTKDASKKYQYIMKDDYLLRASKTLINSKCLKDKKSPVIFIASDVKNPKIDFQKIYSKFNSCVFVLSDFKKHLEPLRDLNNGFGNYNLIHFVDLLVTSNGGIFIGTANSTFSGLARDIHNFQL